MSQKFEVCKNKTLKLENVLILNIEKNDVSSISKYIIQMENDMKLKGVKPIGPYIQYVNPKLLSNGEVGTEVKLIRQSSGFVEVDKKVYSSLPKLRVENCLFLRYIGPEDEINYAYQKINLFAFEENVKLKGDCYTVITNKSEGSMSADIFMQCSVAKNE